MISKKKLYLLGLLTLFGFGGIGILIIEIFQDVSVLHQLEKGWGWEKQLFGGITFGFVSAMLAWAIIKSNYLRDVRHHYTDIMQSINFNWFDIVFISICAGIGEELLFRGAMQFWVGIPITSIIFVAIHGYLRPKNIPLSLYGSYMVVVICVLGYGWESYGIIFPIFAHIVIDVVLLAAITKRN